MNDTISKLKGLDSRSIRITTSPKLSVPIISKDFCINLRHQWEREANDTQAESTDGEVDEVKAKSEIEGDGR